MMALRQASELKRVNIGVLGLGRRWRRRYAPAMQALTHRFCIRAVCDPVQECADLEARRLGCEAAGGPMELIQNGAVDAVLILDAPWYGLWPLQLACRARKPVFCAPGLDVDDAHASALVLAIREAQLPVMVERPLPLTPAAIRLRELTATLGSIRLVTCDWTVGGRRQPSDRAMPSSTLLGRGGGAVLDWCVALSGCKPARVLAAETPAAGLATLMLESVDGPAVQIVRRRVPGPCSALKVQVVCERGTAGAGLPRSVHWTSADGCHTQRLPRPRSLVRALLERFHRAIATGVAPEPSLEESYRCVHWLRAVARSRVERSWVAIGPSE
ncbi:MAG: hypothetical protein K2R98_24550 [Gemmataceae bacterium]|nr:hypothetical protein [Gemmataceae bacterium]